MRTTTPPRSNFADLASPFSDFQESLVAILPVPMEHSTSYGKGTATGPEAIVDASCYVELFDEELGSEPFKVGISTLPAVDGFRSAAVADCLTLVEERVAGLLGEGKFVVVLGGEHSLTLAPVRACREIFGEVGVVQFDAHADLREEYEGSRYSHACVMHRVLDEGLPTLGIGIRSLSATEARLIDERNLKMVWGHQLQHLDRNDFRSLLATLPEQIYLTFDVDFFDPALVPATGTPEPGGGSWYPTLSLLRTLFEEKTVVAMDVVELAPIPNHSVSQFTVARLVYKCVAYLQRSRSLIRRSHS